MKGHTDTSGKFHPHSSSSGLTSTQINLNKKTNRELNTILRHDFTTPSMRKKITEIFEKRVKDDKGFQKHRAEVFWNELSTPQRISLMRKVGSRFPADPSLINKRFNKFSSVDQDLIIKAINEHHR